MLFRSRNTTSLKRLFRDRRVLDQLSSARGPRREAGLPSFPALTPRTGHPDRHPYSGWEAGLVVATAATYFSPVDGSSVCPSSGTFVGGSWGQFPCRNAQPRPPPPAGTHAWLPAGIPERRPSPSPVHLRGPVASTLGARDQRRSPPRGRQGVPGADSPPSPSVSPGRPVPSQARLQRRPPGNLHPPPRPVSTPRTRPGGRHAPEKGRGGDVGSRKRGMQGPRERPAKGRPAPGQEECEGGQRLELFIFSPAGS